MKLLEFIYQFPDEQSCRSHFKQLRIEQGVTCKKCGCQSHYWKKDKQSFQCKSCGFRTGLRNGTVMQASNLPFRYWYITIHLMTSTKKSFSTLELQRQLGHKRYEPIWAMVHKIRNVMGEESKTDILSGFIEMDEGFLTSYTPDAPETKAGRGTIKSPVLVACESTPQKKVRSNQEIYR